MVIGESFAVEPHQMQHYGVEAGDGLRIQTLEFRADCRFIVRHEEEDRIVGQPVSTGSLLQSLSLTRWGHLNGHGAEQALGHVVVGFKGKAILAGKPGVRCIDQVRGLAGELSVSGLTKLKHLER